VEVSLGDLNAGQGGIDTPCTVEIHLAGRPATEHQAGDVDEVVEKVVWVLEHQLGRVDDRVGHTSAAG